MNSQFSIQFSSSDTSSPEFSITLTQEIEDETATVGEAAELVDAIFDIELCDPPPEEDEPKEPVPEEDFEEIVTEKFDMNLCYINDGFDYLTHVIVDRSDDTVPYTLRITNGKLGDTVVTSEEISEHIEVNSQTYVDLKYHPVGEVETSWGDSSTDTPKITVTGKRLSWEGEATGSISAVYLSKYEVVEVTVFGDTENKEYGECTVIAFYYGIVEELELQPPQSYVDDLDLWKNLCNPDIIVKMGDDKNKPQWVSTRTTYKCQCSGDQSRVVYKNEPDHWDIAISKLLDDADKLNEQAKDPTLTNKEREALQVAEKAKRDKAAETSVAHGKALKQYIFPGVIREEFGGYEDCGETTGDMNDPDFYEQVCCDPPEVPLPICKTLYRQNGGGKEIDKETLTELTSQYGNQLKLVPVTPEDGDCGITKTTQVLVSKNCCDVTPPLVYDDENSAEIITDQSSGLVFVSGGRYPLTVSVRGNGFYLDNNRSIKDGYVYSNQFLIYTANACGACQVTVSDGCSSVVGYIRSDNGQWVRVYTSLAGVNGDDSGVPAYPGGCPVMLVAPDRPASPLGETITGESGRYRIAQHFDNVCNVYTARSTYAEAVATCTSLGAPPCATATPLREQGSCFSATPLCGSCGECTGDNDDQADWINFNLGLHAIVGPAGYNNLWAMNSLHMVLFLTLIDEWQC